MPGVLGLQVAKEHETSDALVSVGEWMILDDEVKKICRFFFDALVAWFTKHFLLDITEDRFKCIPAFLTEQ